MILGRQKAVRPFRHAGWTIVAAGALALASCGGMTTTPSGNGGTGGNGGSGGSSTGTTITITSAGVSPKNLTVAQGTQVTFVNNDTRNHTMNSDPHPAHTDCPEINQVGFLTPGQSRQTGNLNTVRTCGYHDHELFSDTSLQGTITIVAK